MKKAVLAIIIIFTIGVMTGCGCHKKEKTKSETSNVEEKQVLEGLEFINVGLKDNTIKTTVVNNTGVTYRGSEFTMKIMDDKGNIIMEVKDRVKEAIKTGSTLTIETKVEGDISAVAAIEYSIE